MNYVFCRPLSYLKLIFPTNLYLPLVLEYQCVSKWETTRDLENTHYIKEIEYKFKVEQREQINEQLSSAKSDISETIDKVLNL